MQNADCRMQYAGLLQFMALLAFTALISGCSDDRKAPMPTNNQAYSETIELFNRTPASGASLSKTFAIDDTVVDGRLTINGYFWPDAGLDLYTTTSEELDSIGQRLLALEGQILNLELKENKTHADSVSLDSLNTLKTAAQGEQSLRITRQDSLDTRLDDRFKVSIWLDGDAIELYPRAIFLDSAAVPGQIEGDETVIWGQGFFASPSLDTDGLRGKRMTLDLKRFWTADPTYRHNTKPARPANPDQLPELFPVADWLTRLTPGSHTLHVRFGEAGSRSEVTASLYVVYKHAG